ncbi:hypothetical protein [Pseudomonas linyingensis]|uniref:hypothetical protein n=1 Tax=Pseudomonas linyingensis TaxID=915471 RepID=UPI0011138526|nr:hypothetical protein [Pseudomonas linyingensis]
MKFSAFTDQQLSSVSSMQRAAQQIKITAVEVMRCIQMELDRYPKDEQSGILSALGDDRVSLKISTPFGEGRCRLELISDGHEVCGRYVVEKAYLSEADATVWKAVWALRVSRREEVMLGDDGCWQDMYEAADLLRRAAASIIYAIAESTAA